MTKDKEKKIEIKIEITDKGNLSIQTVTKLKYGWTQTNMVLIPKSEINEFVENINKISIKKIYFRVLNGSTWEYFDNYDEAHLTLEDIRDNGNSEKYQRVYKVLMTEEEFNNLPLL